MKIIDTRGKLCPAPLILTKKGIIEAPAGEIIEIQTDNDTAFENLINYLLELKIEPQSYQEGNEYTITITKPDEIKEEVNAAAFCTTSSDNYIVVIKADVMGGGDEALGRILLRAFINSLKETTRLPDAVILYNSGVKVALKETDTATSLQELENNGVAIIACGTCVDYYGLKEQLAVGVISNMYKITTLLSETRHIIYP